MNERNLKCEVLVFGRDFSHGCSRVEHIIIKKIENQPRPPKPKPQTMTIDATSATGAAIPAGRIDERALGDDGDNGCRS